MEKQEFTIVYRTTEHYLTYLISHTFHHIRITGNSSSYAHQLQTTDLILYQQHLRNKKSTKVYRDIYNTHKHHTRKGEKRGKRDNGVLPPQARTGNHLRRGSGSPPPLRGSAQDRARRVPRQEDISKRRAGPALPAPGEQRAGQPRHQEAAVQAARRPRRQRTAPDLQVFPPLYLFLFFFSCLILCLWKRSGERRVLM